MCQWMFRHLPSQVKWRGQLEVGRRLGLQQGQQMGGLRRVGAVVAMAAKSYLLPGPNPTVWDHMDLHQLFSV